MPDLRLPQTEYPLYGADGRCFGFRSREAVQRLLSMHLVRPVYGRKGHLRAIYLPATDGSHPVKTPTPGTKYSFEEHSAMRNCRVEAQVARQRRRTSTVVRTRRHRLPGEPVTDKRSQRLLDVAVMKQALLDLRLRTDGFRMKRKEQEECVDQMLDAARWQFTELASRPRVQSGADLSAHGRRCAEAIGSRV